MIPKKRIPCHPGEILLKEFLEPIGMSQLQFSKYLKVPVQRINEIIKGKRGISPETAWLFGEALGTSPELWINLQSNYDLALQKPKYHVENVLKMAV
jgi:addiction module HigA family antidote